MVCKEIKALMKDLGLEEGNATNLRLANTLQMLVDHPEIVYSEWRHMFGISANTLKTPLEKIWYMANKKLTTEIYSAEIVEATLAMPPHDFMVENLAEYAQRRCEKVKAQDIATQG